EHRLEIETRAANDLEYVGGGGLLLQRFAELVEQPRILDGNDGLVGEILNQVDLLVGERADLLAVDSDRAHQRVVLDHWYHEEWPDAAEFNARNCQWVAVKIALICTIVGNMDCLAGLDDTADRS